MTKEERKAILMKYRLSRKLRTTKREKDRFLYRRDFYQGVRYVIFIRNSQIYERGYECIIMDKRTKEIIQRYEDETTSDVNSTLAAWLSDRHHHSRHVDERIDAMWDFLD